ncbi:hypothetical protein LPJ53_002243 [Coemansia erecta]|uniref:Uncharacterized protein n=1 Tax=Coemansia erecta TaxID=147472 RepID=A0A9W8CTQ7_9FUNG|nr:hypothetical protein LPJ53_002243 [Coemansia erecta]
MATKNEAHVLQEVRWFRHTVDLAIQSQRRCEQEIREYSEQIRGLEDQIAASEAEVASLGDSLEISRSHKRYRIAYDEIATEANKRPSRQRLQKDIADINADIDNLHNEDTSHGALMSSLRLQYAHVRAELGRLAEMSANALSVQDLGIIIADADHETHLSSGFSPAASAPVSSTHPEFGSPLEGSGLGTRDDDDDDDDDDVDGNDDYQNQNNSDNARPQNQNNEVDNGCADESDAGGDDNSRASNDNGQHPSADIIQADDGSDVDEDGAVASIEASPYAPIDSPEEEEGECDDDDDDEEGELLM